MASARPAIRCGRMRDGQRKKDQKKIKKKSRTYIELPPLHVLPSLLTRHHNDKLANLALLHPAAELVHNLLDIRLDLVVAGGHHGQAIFLDGDEVLGRVDAALEEDGVAGEVEEFDDGFG